MDNRAAVHLPRSIKIMARTESRQKRKLCAGSNEQRLCLSRNINSTITTRTWSSLDYKAFSSSKFCPQTRSSMKKLLESFFWLLLKEYSVNTVAKVETHSSPGMLFFVWPMDVRLSENCHHLGLSAGNSLLLDLWDGSLCSRLFWGARASRHLSLFQGCARRRRAGSSSDSSIRVFSRVNRVSEDFEGSWSTLVLEWHYKIIQAVNGVEVFCSTIHDGCS